MGVGNISKPIINLDLLQKVGPGGGELFVII
jgi:hypothetical protein